MPAQPVVAFEVVEPELDFELLIVWLNPPTRCHMAIARHELMSVSQTTAMDLLAFDAVNAKSSCHIRREEGREVPTPQNRDGLEVSQQITRLLGVMHSVEQRLVCLIREGAQGVVPPERSDDELALLDGELKCCYRQVADIKGRRDLGFEITVKLREIDDYCVWLYRRVRLEEFFLRKWRLETKLRSLVCGEAFDVYQEILDIEEVEKQLLMRSDSEIGGLLFDEPRFHP